jgi:hypothetical protein
LDDLTPIEMVTDIESDDQDLDNKFTVEVKKKGYGFLRPNKFYSAKKSGKSGVIDIKKYHSKLFSPEPTHKLKAKIEESSNHIRKKSHYHNLRPSVSPGGYHTSAHK